jgi:hypothetical protein
MQDFLQSNHKILSIKYDNGLRKYMNYDEVVFGNAEVYESPKFPKPIQTLVIDFGDTEFEIIGQATWKKKEAKPCSDTSSVS